MHSDAMRANACNIRRVKAREGQRLDRVEQRTTHIWLRLKASICRPSRAGGIAVLPDNRLHHLANGRIFCVIRRSSRHSTFSLLCDALIPPAQVQDLQQTHFPQRRNYPASTLKLFWKICDNRRGQCAQEEIANRRMLYLR
eukprot:1104215-Rhodomonas_salina.2